MTEMLIDDRRCPLRATGLGHLTCIPSELFKVFHTQDEKIYHVPPHTHVNIEHTNTQQETGSEGQIQTRVQFEVRDTQPALFITLSHTHLQ